MGIIIKQSIRNSIISYSGALLGAVNVLIIYERMLLPEELGQMKYIIATAFLIIPMVIMGANSIILRFYPRFENAEKKNHGLLGFGLIMVFIGYCIYLVVTISFYKYLPDKFSENYLFISLLLIAAAVSTVGTSYSASFKEIAVPALFNNLWVKIGIALVVVLYYFGLFTFSGVKWGIVLVYFIPVAGILIFIRAVGKLFIKPDYSILTKENIKDIKSYGIYSALGPVGAVLATQLDQFMVTEMINYESGGIFTISVYVASLFTIPMVAVFSIANPIISQSSDKKDYAHIEEIYKKSSINLLIIGVMFMIVLWTSIDDMFSLMSRSEVYSQGKYVILILGFAKIIDMSTSINGAIIAHSKFFKFNLYILLLLSVINIVANILLIEKYGIIGAAIATFISLAVYNFGKLFYVWLKFKMQPFTEKSLITLLLGLILYFGLEFFSMESWPLILRVVFRSIVVASLFGLGIYFMRLSEDMRTLIIQSFKYIKNVIFSKNRSK